MIISYLYGPPSSLLWGREICGPGPLYIKVQSLSRGEQLPRTHNENPKKGVKDLAEDDLMLGTPQNA